PRCRAGAPGPGSRRGRRPPGRRPRRTGGRGPCTPPPRPAGPGGIPVGSWMLPSYRRRRYDSSSIMKKRPPLLDFDRVRMLRGGKPVLNGLTFRIDVGENVAILGPNGSGKSSLLKLLTRELYPVANDGEFRMKIMGKDRWELFDLRRH